MNLQKKTRSTVKNYQRLGYILYEATTSTWVTFSYELTGGRIHAVRILLIALGKPVGVW
jgi:hypothetical protein